MDSRISWILLICTLAIQAHDLPDGSQMTHARHLFDDLTKNYNKNIRPVENDSSTLPVSFGLTILGVESLELDTQVLTTHVWLKLSWKDFQLKWDPSKFGGISSTRIPRDMLWTPDIHLFNGVDSKQNFAFDALPVIFSDGSVLWIPQMMLRSKCTVDISRFPFDSQICTLKFGSWTYHEGQINLTESVSNQSLDTSMYSGHGDYDLVSTESQRSATKYDCCVEKYVDIQYKLKLARRTKYVTHLYLAPSILMSLLIPFIFILPSSTNDKMLYSVGLLIGHVLTFGQLEEFVPHAYPQMPYIGIYYVTNLVLICFALMFSAITINVWNKSSKRSPVPGVLRTIFLGILGRLLCVKRDDYLPVEEGDPSGMRSLEIKDDQNNLEPGPDDRQRMMRNYSRLTTTAEWRQFATVLDRLFFLIFTIVVIIVAVSIGHQ